MRSAALVALVALAVLAALFSTATGEDAPRPAPGGSAAAAPPPSVAPAPPPARLAMRPAKPHGGFIADLDCSACHTEAGWSLAQAAGASGFDHDRTGFALRGAHVQTSCGGCHQGQGRPAATCEGCHRDPHQGRHDGTCAECHTATAWQDTRALDQHRRTRMPLTGRHATLDCVACHRRSDERRFLGLPSDCFSCHRDDYRRAASPHRHDGTEGPAPFARQCSTCHSTAAWSPAFVDPTLISRDQASTSHDGVFVLSTGSHRSADCASCHIDPRRTQRVRCDTCHEATRTRAQHAGPVPSSAAACLLCHPRGKRGGGPTARGVRGAGGPR
ncbi:MAG: hypothetical protein IPI49_24955 [Myxococcales bacterium]|nr:hypothetical protein [Myxococcales bacterium]